MLRPSTALSRSASLSLNCVRPCSFRFSALGLIFKARATYCILYPLARI
nr:MAG TPA: hypothetical protein [Caudoviricetes sp.]